MEQQTDAPDSSSSAAAPDLYQIIDVQDIGISEEPPAYNQIHRQGRNSTDYAPEDNQIVTEDNRSSEEAPEDNRGYFQFITSSEQAPRDNQVDSQDRSSAEAERVDQMRPPDVNYTCQNSTENEMELRLKLIEEFKCPMCARYMMPPILQFIDGHCVCNNCFVRLPLCVVCSRAGKTEIRCVPLEKFHSKLTFPCVYAKDGCLFRALGDRMSIHQNDCSFASLPCPLGFKNDCSWRGPRPDMIAHCWDSHPNDVFCGSMVKLVSQDFRNLEHNPTIIMVHAYDYMFRCVWNVDMNMRVIRLGVYCLGVPKRGDKFDFAVSYLCKDAITEALEVRGSCYYMEESDQQSFTGKYFTVEYNEVKKLVNEENCVHYVLTIIKVG